MKKNKILLAVVLCLSLLLGCAPGGTDPQTTEPTEPEESQSTEESRPFGLCYQADGGFNPYTTTRLINRPVLSLVYQGLFVTNSQYRAEPVLCKSFAHTDDLKTYRFLLENATFSDGSPLEAGDVVASLKAATGSAVYGNRLRLVTGITALGPQELEITLSTACESLPQLLDIPIVRQEDVAASFPLGTGAYYLAQGTGLFLQRRSDWWSDYEPPVSDPRIMLLETIMPGDVRDEFEFGATDLVCADPASDSYVDYRCDYELWDCSTGIMVYLGCNVDKGAFSNAILRSALTYALDRDAITALYKGFGRKALLPADPAADCYDTVLASKYDLDIEKFQNALVESRQSGRSVRILVNKDSDLRVAAAGLIADQLTALGMAARVEAKGLEEFRRALRDGEYELFLGELRLSPNFDLATFFLSNGAACYGGMNSGNLMKLNTMAMENSGNYYDLFKGVMDDGRLCPLLFRTYAVFTTRGVIPELSPALDCVFHSTNTRQLSDALVSWEILAGPAPAEPEPTENP